MGISTHVLDLSRGRPAAGIAVALERREGEHWVGIASHRTDADGRVRALLAYGQEAEAADYRLRFDVGEYLERHGETAFFPHVHIEFRLVEPGGNHHVPLLLSPYGYSTYRGS